MKMKKILALALAMVMCFGLMAACSNNPPANTTTPDATPTNTTTPDATPTEPAGLSGTLKVSLWDQATQPAFNAVIDGFVAANPDVTVEVIDVPSGDYTTKLNVMLNGGSEVDVFWVKDADTIYPISKRGQLTDLSSYIAADGINLDDYNGLPKFLEIDGAQVAMPFRMDYYVNFYNKDIFDAAGVAYPTNDMTWAEFEALAAQVTSGEGVDKKYGAHFHTWQALVQNWAVQDGVNTMMNKDLSIFTPYYEMILRMQNDDQSIMDFGTLKTANLHYNSVFPDGSAAMMPMGTWFAATMIQKVKDGESTVNWGIATIPHPEGTPAGYTVGSTTPIAINAASPNQDLAWEFVKFACGDEGAAIVAGTGAFPAKLNDEMLTIITSVDGMPEGSLEALRIENNSLDRPIEDKVSEVNQMLGEEHSLIMLGEISVEDGVAEMTTRTNEIQG